MVGLQHRTRFRRDELRKTRDGACPCRPLVLIYLITVFQNFAINRERITSCQEEGLGKMNRLESIVSVLKSRLVILPLCATCAMGATGEGVFKAGAAKGNITPTLGAKIVGSMSPYPCNHVHDDLWVRALVLDDGTTRLSLVVCDLIGISSGVYERARRLLHEEAKLPVENLMVSVVHTHSAADARRSDKRWRKEVELCEYESFVARRIADTVRCAIDNLEPAHIGWGAASAPEHVFNRRRFMKPGTVPMTALGGTNDVVRFNPGYLNPDIVKPAGPVDPELCFFAVRSPDGKPIALFANYALHYVGGVRGADVSADYFGVFNDRIMQLLQADRQDPPFVSIMSNGASGDINNGDFDNPAPKHQPYEKMRIVAHDLARKVVESYKGIEWRDHARLQVAWEEIELGLRRATPDELAFARNFLSQVKEGSRPDPWKNSFSRKALASMELPETWRFPLQVLKIGELGIGAMPFEPFCEIGLEFKKRANCKPAFIVELANGCYDYLPTPEQHALGGYETWLGINHVEKQASSRILERLLGMLNGLPR